MAEQYRVRILQPVGIEGVEYPSHATVTITQSILRSWEISGVQFEHVVDKPFENDAAAKEQPTAKRK